MNLYERKLLLVDDNRELLLMIRDTLERNGYYRIVTAGTVEEGMRRFEEEHPDMAVLDIMLPDGDGFELFRRIREMSQIPILFLSARDQDHDRLFGLGLGADDYITKPFLAQELALRVKAVLKRTYSVLRDQEEVNKLILGRRRVSFEEGEVVWEEGRAQLTAKELTLLKKLSDNRGKIVTFDALCEAAWQDSYYGYENTLMVHIRHLREKLEEDPSHPRWLLTVRGLGYRLAGER